MERRTFLGMTAGAVMIPAGALPASPAQAAAIQQRVIEWYRAFGNPRTDPTYYRSFMTDDYLLLENGELLDVAGDMAMMASLQSDYVRTDTFDFRHAWMEGDHAYLVYFLDSKMDDSKNGPRTRRWLESAILRRDRGAWRAAILHSTRINPPPK